jgi:superfamily I DNA and/or RNA helicase
MKKRKSKTANQPIQEISRIMKIPYKYQSQTYKTYWNLNNEGLFEFFVLKLIELNRHKDFYTSNQFGNIIFGNYDSPELKKIFTEYNTYFETVGSKRKLNSLKVFLEHPWIWGVEKATEETSILEQLSKAIDHEIRESRRMNVKCLTIEKIDYKATVNNNKLFIYNAEVILDNDDFISLSEGERIEIILNSNSKLFATILDFNVKSNIISFQTNVKIKDKTARIKTSSLFILYRLKETISSLEENDSFFWKFIKKESFDNVIQESQTLYYGVLDKSQQLSVENSVHQHITFLWGPPGTGKSFTLAYLLLNLLQLNKKTIVCTIANIAVDVLLLKLVETLEQSGEIGKKILKDKKIMRLGYSQSDQIRQIPYLKFESKRLTEISSALIEIKQDIDYLIEEKTVPGYETKILVLKSKRDDLKREYDSEVKRILSSADMVFLTSSKFITDDGLKELEFDNLVIDEGSMMPLPHLLPLSQHIMQRIVVCGDFQQLGPIALSKSSLSQKWLHKDLFSLLGNSDREIMESKFITMINSQRRSAVAIVNLFNSEFYNNKLRTIDSTNHLQAIESGIHTSNIKFINLEGKVENRVDYSGAKSRYNSFSRKKVYDFLNTINDNQKDFKFEVGIICPYRQQVVDYKRELVSKNYNFSITVGTIHTFQGSECDIIIWDFVDASNQPIGKIYRSKEGERLVNVAISRAKSLLVLVGDRKIFQECNGHDTVSRSIPSIINKAWSYYLDDYQKQLRLKN